MKKFEDRNLDINDVCELFEELSERLEKIYPNEKFTLVIVGGVPLMQFDNRKKSKDIDGYTLSDRKIRKILEESDINFRSSGMSSSFSADMEDRLQPTIFSHDNLTVYAASLEDIVASKLIANRDKDYEDIRLQGVVDNLDFDLLDSIIKDELSIDISNEYNYRQLRRVYDDYLDDLFGKRNYDR